MDGDVDNAITKAIMGNALSDEDVGAAVRLAFTFLTACVSGDVAEIKTNERITAANAILQYAIRRPDMLADVANTALEVMGDG